MKPPTARSANARSDRFVAEISESLRGPSAVAVATAAGVDAVERVVSAVRSLLDENEALAEEVLRGYEQLNLLFDFTRQITALTDADEIVDVLLHRVSHIFSASAVYLVEPAQRTRLVVPAADGTVRPAWLDSVAPPLQSLAERVREKKCVMVDTTPEAQMLAGPLTRLDSRLSVVLVQRLRDARAFDAGDTLVLESVLTLAGPIIGNSELHERLRRMSMETARALVAAIDKKDHYTRGHSERVGLLARLTGREMGLAAPELQTLEWAGLLHDVGKIGVSEAILRKPGALTPEEFDEIKKHPAMGYEILKPVASLGPVLDGVLYHHENPDGSGYPTGRVGPDIPLFARIIHVVDVFDALTSARAYRPAFTVEQACAILRADAGSKLDGDATAAFLGVLDRMRALDPGRLNNLYALQTRESQP